ncbi:MULTISPECIES: LamG-like jellyroll fold domain-containing protein [unclassified Streptomyces]|uniref:LamG-like jellyroll fold domain-containing protein n=1 Tax=unclassified Streptomyces TaxID=2593676 RepID=UPI0037F36BA4
MGRSAATTVTLLLAVTALPVPQAHATPSEAEPTTSSEGRQALDQALRTGQRVEVTGERTDRTTTWANPDGFTFSLEQSTTPVRVPTSGGGWQAPDASLVKRPDGSVGPKAAAVSISFSPGGDKEPLARIEDQGKALELSWPGTLPTPRLNGSSALYADVLPSVDLLVTATPESFRHVFVVKTPEAAANAELKKLTFGLKAEGLHVREATSNSLFAIDESGRTVFKAPPARMWDSAGAAAGSPSRSVKAGARAVVGTDSADPSEEAPSGSGLEPGQGDAVARMNVAVTQDSLSVVPDPDMLTGTDASAFPLYIDPPVTWGESERTLLRSDGYESYGWGNGEDDQGKGAGKCGTWNGYYCGPGYVQKLYFEYSPDSLRGKKILSSTFRVTEPWALQCDPRWVDLVRTNNISSATTWSSRPKELDLMVDRNVSAGRGSLCDPDSPNAPIEFKDNPDETNENLTSTIQNFAAGKFSRLTLEIKAHDETDTAAWKRFKNDAVLDVKFVGLPDTPTEVGLTSGKAYVCASSSTTPSVVSSPTPLAQGKPRTRPGGSPEANLRIRWRTEKYDGSAWSLAHADVDSPTSGYAGNLAKQARTLPRLQEGVLYRLKALTLSYYEDGSNRLNSDYGAVCYFKVDPTAPKAPRIAFGATYTECVANDCAAHGGPGQADTFTLSPAVGETNVVAYQYRLSGDGAWSADQKGSTVPLKVTPERAGTHRLYVRAKDNVGRPGEETVVDFLVAAGQGPVSRWRFDESSGVAKDSATSTAPRHDATLGGSAVRDDRGRRGLITRDAQGEPLASPTTDKGLALNGTGGYAATNGPVLETRSAYTVSAWARLADNTKDGIVLSQDGQNYSAFIIYYSASNKSWTFGVKEKDAATGAAYFGVVGKAPAALGAWTHLAGSYDPETQELKFYVNGVLQGTRSVTSGWSATGAFNIGRYLWAGQRIHPFNGSIDEVAAWQRVLTDPEVRDEARAQTSAQYRSVELVADWSADRGSGTAVTDTTSGYGRTLTLAGGASLDGEAIVLDGVDGAATAAGPVVDDTGSFTATTLVSLDGDALKDKSVGYTGQVIGQRSADGSAWGLWYRLTGRTTVPDEETGEEKTVPVGDWYFGRLEPDGSLSAVRSEESAVVDGAVRATGVFDAQDGEISLYLGGVQNGDDKVFSAKAGSGDFALGKGFSAGAWQHFLPGRVAETRMWAGAMAGPDQIEELVGD